MCVDTYIRKLKVEKTVHIHLKNLGMYKFPHLLSYEISEIGLVSDKDINALKEYCLSTIPLFLSRAATFYDISKAFTFVLQMAEKLIKLLL